MIGIVITESRNKPTTEAKFFTGLKNASLKYFKEDLCMVRESHYTKPNTLRSEIDNMLRNDNIAKVYIICDNEDDKIQKTNEVIKVFSESKKKRIVFATEHSHAGYTFEHFAGHANTSPSCLSGDEHKSEYEPFNFLGKKYHPNFAKKDPIHFKGYLENLSRDKYIGLIIMDMIKVLKTKTEW